MGGFSNNTFYNRALKIFGRGTVYVFSVAVGQALARGYWVYKRSYNATSDAMLDAVLMAKITARYNDKSVDAIEDD